MGKLSSTIFLVVLFLSVSGKNVLAAKKFVPKKGATSTVRRSTGFIPVSAHYRPDKRAILFNFSNFANLSSVSYLFSYTANGIPQGAAGTITASSSPSEVRELLFGTCSTGVCTYHTGLANARLSFTATLTNGTQAVRNFRIRTYF